jgi:hypothetical protein
MPIVTVYRNGATAGMAGNNPSPAKRDVIKGWSSASVRRHTKWLYSIDAPRLDGEGFALTLTMKHTPESADAFHSARRAWIKRIERLGASRVHWVIEWQRRGTPHIHAAVYFPEGVADANTPVRMLLHWIAVAEQWGAGPRGQYFDTISGPLGWLKYLSKHASRGVKHYQRMGAPVGWERTGRLWGHTGEWPADEPMRFDMSREAYWRLRRLVRSWRVADARQSGDRSRIVYARRMLQSSDPKLSAVRGVSDWVPEHVAVEFVSLLVSQGFDVTDHGNPSDES